MKVLGRLPAAAVVAVLAVVNTAASSVVPPRETPEHTRTRARTASLLNRPSADSAVKLIIEMEAERQREESRRLTAPYPYTYPHPRLIFPYTPYIYTPRAANSYWRHMRASPPFWGMYSIHGHLNPQGIRYFLDPRAISEIGWDRALSRVPGVVIR